MKRKETQNKRGGAAALTAVGIVICVILALVLAGNIAIVIQGYVTPETPPKLFGVTPMIVLSGSMDDGSAGCIKTGDLIFATDVDPATLEEGDVITFMEGNSAVTHRIVEIGKSGTALAFTTKGDANNTEDRGKVYEDDVVGKYVFRVGGLGDVMMFIQKPVGMLIVVGVPLILLVLLDVLRGRKKVSSEQKRTEELEAELERLRALAQGAQTAGGAEAPEPEVVLIKPEQPALDEADEVAEATDETAEATDEVTQVTDEAAEVTDETPVDDTEHELDDLGDDFDGADDGYIDGDLDDFRDDEPDDFWQPDEFGDGE